MTGYTRRGKNSTLHGLWSGCTIKLSLEGQILFLLILLGFIYAQLPYLFEARMEIVVVGDGNSPGREIFGVGGIAMKDGGDG